MTTESGMRVDEARDRLAQMLTAAGIDPDCATLSEVWPVYQEFARTPVVDQDEVQILAQWGTYNFYIGRDTFTFDLTRQFILEEDGEYAGMEQLGCTFLFEPTEELATLRGNMWSTKYPDLDAFFAAVEAQPAFQRVVALGTPMKTQIRQEEV
jgi:hypothetical protein